MSNKLRLVRIAVIAVVLVIAAAVAWFLMNGERARQAVLPQIEIGGPFRLASSNGGIVDSKDLLGKPYGIFFGYTHCPDVCPTTLYEMSQVLSTLGDEAKDFRLFFVTVDPARDTAPMLKDYMSNFDPRMEGLVPTPEQLPVIAKEFRVFYKKVPGSDGGYTMDHTATLFLMNGKGHLASTIAFGEAENVRLAKLRKLISGG